MDQATKSLVESLEKAPEQVEAGELDPLGSPKQTAKPKPATKTKPAKARQSPKFPLTRRSDGRWQKKVAGRL